MKTTAKLSTTLNPPPEAVTARANLATKLASEPVLPCENGEALDEDPAVQKYCAEHLCPGCPVWALCRAAGTFEAFGCWGGVVLDAPLHLSAPELRRRYQARDAAA